MHTMTRTSSPVEHRFCRERCDLSNPEHKRTTFTLSRTDYFGVLRIFNLCRKEAEYIRAHDDKVTVTNDQTGETLS